MLQSVKDLLTWPAHYTQKGNIWPQMHFWTYLYYDLHPLLFVDMKLVSIVKSDFMK